MLDRAKNELKSTRFTGGRDYSIQTSTNTLEYVRSNYGLKEGIKDLIMRLDGKCELQLKEKYSKRSQT